MITNKMVTIGRMIILIVISLINLRSILTLHTMLEFSMPTLDMTKLRINIQKLTQIKKMRRFSGLEIPPKLLSTRDQICSLLKLHLPNLEQEPNGMPPNSISTLDLSILSTTRDLILKCIPFILLRMLSVVSNMLQ